VFERFYKSDKSRGQSSTGLGLAIAKMLIENNHGEITAKIESDCFIVDIFLKEVI